MKTTPNRMISIQLEREEMGLQSLYCGKFDPKREVCTLKGTMTLTDYKSLFLYTHLYLQALIQVPSVTIQWNPGSFYWIPVPLHWNPADSCGIQQNGCIPAGICGASTSTAYNRQPELSSHAHQIPWVCYVTRHFVYSCFHRHILKI